MHEERAFKESFCISAEVLKMESERVSVEWIINKGSETKGMNLRLRSFFT